MNLLQNTARKMIKLSFDFVVSTIMYFTPMAPYIEKVDALRKLPKGTLGKEIASCLDAHGLVLVPKFESHDLKHVLLGYKMTPEGEIRLQAFMLGNGNRTLPSLAIFIFGALLLPSRWSMFYADYQKGKKSYPISSFSIENYATHNLAYLKSNLFQPTKQGDRTKQIPSISKIGAFVSITAGVFGMLYCLPYLFSSSLEDLVGAGFPFVGGAILAAGGLFTLSNIEKQPPATAVGVS